MTFLREARLCSNIEGCLRFLQRLGESAASGDSRPRHRSHLYENSYFLYEDSYFGLLEREFDEILQPRLGAEAGENGRVAAAERR